MISVFAKRPEAFGIIVGFGIQRKADLRKHGLIYFTFRFTSVAWGFSALLNFLFTILAVHSVAY